jgi:conjugal transfer pilus assembly protein TraB
MSLNENLKTRRKQLAILAAVIMAAQPHGGVIWYGQYQQEQNNPRRSPHQT